MPARPALLFDLDGTLAHTDPLHFRVFRDMLAEHGIHIDEAFFASRISGRLNEHITQDLFPDWTPAERTRFADAKEAVFRELTPSLAPMPGLLALLRRARDARWPTALVTNAPGANVVASLAAIGLADEFDVRVIAEELPRGKPDPLPYLTALERLGVPAGEALAFEDSRSGVRAAVAAGIATFGITSTLPPSVLHEAGAFETLRDFDDPKLQAELERRFAAP